MPTNGQFTDLTTLPASDINTLLSRGYSNRIINGAFVINQRGYTSGTNLASGAYGFDRWKSGFTNTALTFTAGSQSTLVTISTSGVLQQIVERENVPAGTYTLSWTGTATGRVYNAGATPPVYADSPIIVSLDGSANVVVEFTAAGGTRTLGTVQLEGGNVFSPFEYRHRGSELQLCQRYFQRFSGIAYTQMGFGFFGATTTNGVFFYYLGTPFRIVPHTLLFGNVRATDLATAYTINTLSISSARTSQNVIALDFNSSGGAAFRPIQLEANDNVNGFLSLSAEL